MIIASSLDPEGQVLEWNKLKMELLKYIELPYKESGRKYMITCAAICYYKCLADLLEKLFRDAFP